MTEITNGQLFLFYTAQCFTSVALIIFLFRSNSVYDSTLGLLGAICVFLLFLLALLAAEAGVGFRAGKKYRKTTQPSFDASTIGWAPHFSAW